MITCDYCKKTTGVKVVLSGEFVFSKVGSQDGGFIYEPQPPNVVDLCHDCIPKVKAEISKLIREHGVPRCSSERML